MTVAEFCREKTRVYQLCVIRDCGWIVETVWIDHEDIFRLSERRARMKVIESKFGTLPICDANGNHLDIPCLYIDAE